MTEEQTERLICAIEALAIATALGNANQLHNHSSSRRANELLDAVGEKLQRAMPEYR